MDMARTQMDGRAKAGSIEAAISDTLDRCERSQADLDAFVGIARESALATARKLDANEKPDASSGALAGIPISVKDILNVAGLPTNWGSRLMQDAAPATADTIAVARLRAAGAVIVGKSTTTEFAIHDGLLAVDRPDRQSLGCKRDMRRIELRRRRIRRRRAGSDCADHRRRRLDTPAGGLHRRARAEADTRAHSA